MSVGVAVTVDGRFPVGAGVTLAELAGDPHPALRRLRATEPVSWLPALGGWLVSRADLAGQVVRDSRTFTVDDPRFTTARVVGPSMLSLDGAEHRRHRDPFATALRAPRTRARLAAAATAEADRLVAGLAARGTAAELRRGLAGQLAVAVMADMLGLDVSPAQLLAWYDAIVAEVSALPAGDGPGREGAAADQRGNPQAGAGGLAAGAGQPGQRVAGSAAAAFAQLSACVQAVLAAGRADHSVLAAVAGDVAAGDLTVGEIVSNAAVLLFGGIETTEGMIANAVWYVLRDPDGPAKVRADPDLLEPAVDEALRLEPAAAVIDRYATADVVLGPAAISRGDLVTVSLCGANRDPAVFPDPDRFDLHRANARQHLAFAVGPHFCIGAQLARLEASAALAAMLRLPGLRLDPDRPSSPHGLVFRKPPSLHVYWDG
jgi:cytochrome P450